MSNATQQIVNKAWKFVNVLHTSRFSQAILKRAFNGKLVPQDPSDEPPTVLLERICAARAAQNPPRAQKRRQAPA